MNRAFKESFIPILGLLGLLFLLLLYVRYLVGLDADEVTVITIHASSEESAEGELAEEEFDTITLEDPQTKEVLELISAQKWQKAELRLQQLVKQRDDALIWAMFGVLRYKQQRHDEALNLLDRAATKSPTWPNLFFYRALVNSRLGNLAAAERDYRKLAEFNANHFEAHYNLGIVLLQQNRYRDAAEVLERATTLGGGERRARAYYQFGRALLEQGESFREQAINNFKLAIRHFPAFIAPRLALAKMEPETEEGMKAAEQQFLTVLELDAGNSSALFALAQLDTARGEDEAAIKRYRELLRFSPEHIAGRYNLGLLMLGNKQWREALEQFNRVIEAEPVNVTALFNRGRAYYRMKEYPAALEDYRKALDLKQGDYPEALLNIGLVYVALNDYSAAQQSYRQALQRRENYASAWYNLGLLHVREGRADEALDDFKRTVHLRDDYVQAWYNLGLLYARMDDNEKSITAYEKALTLRPHYAKARLNLAVRWMRAGDPLKAIEHYRMALDADDTYSTAWYNLALAYIALKRYEDAENALVRMLALEPDSIKGRRLLANALTALDRDADAVKVLEEAVDIKANSTSLRLALAKSLRKTGDLQRARSEIYKGLALNADDSELLAELVLLEKGLNMKSEEVK